MNLAKSGAHFQFEFFISEIGSYKYTYIASYILTLICERKMNLFSDQNVVLIFLKIHLHITDMDLAGLTGTKFHL